MQIQTKDGYWEVNDELVQQILDNPPKPGTLLGLPVINDTTNPVSSDDENPLLNRAHRRKLKKKLRSVKR